LAFLKQRVVVCLVENQLLRFKKVNQFEAGLVFGLRF